MAFETTDGTSTAPGTDFPDALGAVAAAGHLNAPVLLVTHDAISVSTRAQLDRFDPEPIWLIGGTAVIGDDVFNVLP